MDKKLRKIDYKGDTYISSEDLRELLEDANSMDELREALFPKKEKEELSDFNQKLVKGLGFNPNSNKQSLNDCQDRISKYAHLVGKTFVHTSNSHHIKIIHVACIETDNGFRIHFNYKNLNTLIDGGVISLEDFNRDYYHQDPSDSL